MTPSCNSLRVRMVTGTGASPARRCVPVPVTTTCPMLSCDGFNRISMPDVRPFNATACDS